MLKSNYSLTGHYVIAIAIQNLSLQQSGLLFKKNINNTIRLHI